MQVMGTSSAAQFSIISGGQTGVDRGALDAALAAGIPCGGWCPRGRRAEDGAIPQGYPMRELPFTGYRARTLRNVEESDGTWILHFGDVTGGTRQTLLMCDRVSKPVLVTDASSTSPQQAAGSAAAFVRGHRIATLNVAGPRESTRPGATVAAASFVAALIQLLHAT